MCGQPTSCCRIALRHRLLINSTNWNTCFLSLNRFIKVTEGHYRRACPYDENADAVWSKNSCGFVCVVFQESPEPFTTPTWELDAPCLGLPQEIAAHCPCLDHLAGDDNVPLIRVSAWRSDASPNRIIRERHSWLSPIRGLQRAFMDISGQCLMKVLHTQEVINIHVQHCREEGLCPPASRYANASSSALASCRSAVSNPSVNQP